MGEISEPKKCVIREDVNGTWIDCPFDVAALVAERDALAATVERMRDTLTEIATPVRVIGIFKWFKDAKWCVRLALAALADQSGKEPHV